MAEEITDEMIVEMVNGVVSSVLDLFSTSGGTPDWNILPEMVWGMPIVVFSFCMFVVFSGICVSEVFNNTHCGQFAVSLVLFVAVNFLWFFPVDVFPVDVDFWAEGSDFFLLFFVFELVFYFLTRLFATLHGPLLPEDSCLRLVGAFCALCGKLVVFPAFVVFSWRNYALGKRLAKLGWEPAVYDDFHVVISSLERENLPGGDYRTVKQLSTIPCGVDLSIYVINI